MLVAFVGLAAVEGCGSDSHGTKTAPLGTAGASGAAGAAATGAGGSTGCNPAYCPMVSAGTQCCVDANTCGYNPGQGCLPFAKPDAGAH